MNLWTAPFWKAVAERAARTVAQTFAALWVANAFKVDWSSALVVVAGAGLLSVATSVAAGAVSPATGPSLGTETPVPARPTPKRRRTPRKKAPPT